MSFDLSSVLEAAKTAVEGTSSNSNYPTIIYPANGTIRARLLFNPKSNSVMRLIHRHKLDSGKVDCAAHYGQDCPVCKQLETIRAVKGLDLWTLKSKTYGIAYAQFIDVSTGYDFGNRRNVPKRGDLIVLMFPWSVYSQISSCIQKAGENASQLLTDNESKPIIIERKLTNDRVEYRVDVDTFSTFQSCESQAQFDKFLMDLPDLSDTITPKDMPEGLLTKLQLEADNLVARYLGSAQTSYVPPVPSSQPSSQQQLQSTSNVVTPATAQIVSDNSQPVQTNSNNISQDVQQPQSEVQNSTNGSITKECFGNLNLSNKDCLICPHTIECSKASKK